MGRVSTWQIIVILVIILLLFGAPKLPELARSVGKSLRILKDETKSLASDGDDSKDDAVRDDAAKDDADDEARDK